MVLVDPQSTETQLSRWRAAAQLSHPNLLRVFACGRCGLGGMDLVYAVMEYAPEDLSQILPQRALTGDETREMIEPVLGALRYLHSKNLVHGHLKPSNILAIDDQVKLSVDALSPNDESRSVSRELDVYDAPEAAGPTVSTAADVWSLGMSVVETLTQSLPVRQDGLEIDPLLPDNLPSPFLEMARHSLRLDPHHRWTAANIAEHLNPKPALAASVAAGVSAAGSSTSAPLSPAEPSTAAKLSVPTLPAISREAPLQNNSPSSSRYVLPTAAGALALLALLLVPRFFSQHAVNPPSPSPAPARSGLQTSDLHQPKPQQKAKAAKKDAPAVAAAPAAQPPAPSSLKTASEKQPVERPSVAAKAVPPPASAGSSNASAPASRGEVLDQVLPQVSDKARATIHGTVHVAVTVHVDAAGNVTEAELNSPSPSRFFADLALQAAHKWEFTPPEAGGHSVPSAWQIRFEFTQSGTKIFPKQLTP